MNNIFLTNNLNETYNFESIKINWTQDRISITFIKEGFVTDCYHALECYKKAHLPIKNIYLISNNENGSTTKELLWAIKILNFSYPEFVDWITNHITSTTQNSSGNFESKNIKGLEIRLHSLLENNLFPSVLGCELISTQIVSKWSS